MYHKSKLLYQIIKKNKRVNRMRISLQIIESVSMQQSILIKDLAFILGISCSSLYVLRKKQRNTVFLNLEKEMLDIKGIVKMYKIT